MSFRDPRDTVRRRRLAGAGLGLLAAAGLGVLGAAAARGQEAGEFLKAWVVDVPSDIFGCAGNAPCNLRYRMYHLLSGAPEINMGPGMDGIPSFRKRGAYESDMTATGNFPGAMGRYGMPFFVVWDGVISPGSPDHVGYYGAQSQMVNYSEQGDSSRANCSSYPGVGACFEPLSSITSSQTLQGGLSSIGGLAPIPVPRARSSGRGDLTVEWDQARGYAVADGAPLPLTGYRIYAYRGRNPTEGALRGAVVVGETGSIYQTRLTVPAEHPALAGAGEVTLAIKMLYVGNLESLFFSANSEPVKVGEGEEDDDEGEEEEDQDPADDASDEELAERGRDAGGDRTGGGATGGAQRLEVGAPPAGAETAAVGTGDQDADGIPDAADLCPGLADPEQADADGDGVGDACDPDADGDGVADDEDCDPSRPEAGRPARSVTGPLAVGIEPGALLSWPAGDGLDLVYRGRRGAGEPFQYNHACLLSGLSTGRADDPELPRPGEALYYVVTGDSGCGAALPGTTSDGVPRPGGEACLRAHLAGRPQDAGGVWSVRPLGGPGRTLYLELVLAPPPTARDLYAVAVEMVFDPARLEPAGLPRAGELLEEAVAPLRVDVQGSAPAGLVRITVSRTGVQGGVAAGRGPGTLLATRWEVKGAGPVQVSVRNVQALDSSFSPVSLPAPAAPFLVQVE